MTKITYMELPDNNTEVTLGDWVVFTSPDIESFLCAYARVSKDDVFKFICISDDSNLYDGVEYNSRTITFGDIKENLRGDETIRKVDVEIKVKYK